MGPRETFSWGPPNIFAGLLWEKIFEFFFENDAFW